MSGNENPAQRANAGSRANSKHDRVDNTPSPIAWEAQAAADWLAARLRIPAALARLLAALASLGRAIG